jgi:imidazolonepropionase-like amidohydrolase
MSGTTRIDDVRIFDGAGTRDRGCVEFDDRVLTYVGPPGGSGREAHTRIDGRGHTLLPGLIDAHTHVYGDLDNLALALTYGVTTELDMLSFPPELARHLCEQAAGRTDIADLRTVGTAAGPPGGPMSVTTPHLPTATAAGAGRFVADRVAEGAHFLKIILDDGRHHGLSLPTFDEATVRALVDAAHERGLLTVAHISGIRSLETAVSGGADVVTHIPADVVLGAGLITAIRRRGTTFVPTLAAAELALNPSRARRLGDDPLIGRWLPGHARSALATGTVGLPVAGAGSGLDFTTASQNVRRLHEAGVPVLAGSDASNTLGRDCPVIHGASLHRELDLLLDAGMRPVEVLAAATAGVARRFGLADRGELAVGKRADLLLVHGDPTTRVTDCRAIAGVWREGVASRRTDRRSETAALRGHGDG